MKFLNLLILISVLIFNAPETIATEAGPGSGLTIGTVAETIEAGSYVYLKLEEQDIWIAATNFPVSAGDQVQYSGSSEMRNFYSKSMDRTFDSIFFVQNASLANKDTVKMHTATVMKSGVGTPSRPAPVKAPAAGEITPLTEGKTVAGIVADSAGLDGQEVKVNARVMKVSKDILGRNWITLQDGTGTQPDNKLVVTSQEVPSKGDVFIATGTVRTDIDIGSGYQYKVLLEETTFSPGFE